MSSKEYMVAYRQANRVGLREYDKAYRVAHSEQTKAIAAKSRAKHKERIRVANAKWRAENAGVRREYAAAYSKKNPQRFIASHARYRAAHPEREHTRHALYLAKNAPIANAATARHRAAKKNAMPAWANKFFISEAYHLARFRTKLTGIEWHVDHIVPLQSPLVCGLHVENNLQVIPKSVNQRKNNRHWPDMPMPSVTSAVHSLAQ